MVLGLSLHAFTVLHVIITLVELFAGAVVVLKMVGGSPSRLNGLFLITGALTTLTGFLFPFHGMTPAIVLGFYQSSVSAAGSCCLVYRACARSVAGDLCPLCAGRALFRRVRCGRAVVPEDSGATCTRTDGKEPPFAAAQGLVLLVFLVIGYLAVKRFRPVALADAR